MIGLERILILFRSVLCHSFAADTTSALIIHQPRSQSAKLIRVNIYYSRFQEGVKNVFRQFIPFQTAVGKFHILGRHQSRPERYQAT